MTTETENEEGRGGGLIGRRKFLIFGGAGAAVLVGTAGAARALITAGGPNPSPRSLPPVGLNPVTGRADGAIAAPPGGVYQFALAGTDGWVTMPLASADHLAGVADNLGAAPIGPYFPDPLADPANTTTYAFCFRNVTGLDRDQVAAQKGRTQICAPIIYSTVGQELWITLTNLGLVLRPDLVDGHTLHWHGFRNAIPFYDGVPESSIAVAIDHDFTYVYRPEDSGTYMYHCHFEDVEHVTMGMHGIVFVKPDPADRVAVELDGVTPKTLTPKQFKAYGTRDGDSKGETWYDREFAIMLSEVDTRAHFNDAHIQATDWTDFHADFWTMNGRAYPDTLAPNGRREPNGDLFAQSVGVDGISLSPIPREIDGEPNPADRLFSNPLSSLVQCKAGDRVLVRFANLGFLNHSIVFPGLEVDVLGRDSRFVPDTAQRKSTDTIQIGPGESRDVFFTAPTLTDYGTLGYVDLPFYDRGMSHYTGSADGSDAWVGGQRSAVRVFPALADQLKPNGWGGESEWPGEFPRKITHAGPTVTVTGTRFGGFVSAISGTTSASDGATVTNLWRFTGPSAPTPGSASWIAINDNSPANYGPVLVGTATPRTHWVLAKDSLGAYSTAVSVTI